MTPTADQPAPNQPNTSQPARGAAGKTVLDDQKAFVFTGDPAEFDRYKFARELIEREGKHRRDRQWTIFAWVASLLLALIPAVIALQGTGTSLTWGQMVLLSIDVGLFVAFGFIRIRHDQGVSDFYAEVSAAVDSKFKSYVDISRAKKWHPGHKLYLVLLGVTTLIVIWLPKLQQGWDNLFAKKGACGQQSQAPGPKVVPPPAIRATRVTRAGGLSACPQEGGT